MRIIAPSHSEGSACLNIGAPDRYPFVPGGYVAQQFLHGAIGVPSTNRQHLIDNLLDTAKAEHIVQKQFDILVGQQFGFVPKVMGQLAATEIQVGVALLAGGLVDLLTQVFLFSLQPCNLLVNMICRCLQLNGGLVLFSAHGWFLLKCWIVNEMVTATHCMSGSPFALCGFGCGFLISLC